MKNLKRIILSFFLPLFFIGCHSGEERTRYTPSIAPATQSEIIIGVHPYLNTQKMFFAYEPILRYLEERMEGVVFRLETSLDYADYERKLVRGDFHFSLPNPYQTIQATQNGYSVVAKMKNDTLFRGVIVARKDRRIRSVEQLRGERISFPAPTALAATMMPKWFLHERGLNVDTDAFALYVGSQYSSIMNAYSKNTAAAATWPTPWIAWQEENPQKAQEMELVWETPPLVNNGFVVRSDVDRNLTDKVVELLCAMESTPEGQRLLAQAGFEGFERASDATYDPVRRFLARYGSVIGLPK
jgi:phosphonate transport system substrate-binding protein